MRTTQEAQPTEGNSSGTEQEEDAMATLGRSLKSPSYLTRARRPGMVRALSNSSDLSVASADSGRDNDDHHMDFVMSGPNTPLGERTQQDAMTSVPSETKTRAAHAELPSTGLTLRPIESSTLQSARLDRSRPIAIELPQIRSHSLGQDYTPPEPLSARGDRPGGFFPLHEDPKDRVHRFQPGAKKSRQPHPTLQLPPDLKPQPVQTRNYRPAAMPDSVNSMSSNTPVASYNPSGALDASLPMGKYYPSNYEKTHRPALSSQPSTQQGIIPPPVVGAPSSVKSDSQLLTRPAGSSNDSEVKRKLQQYQRDMIAQARLAANQVLGDGAHSATPIPPATVTLNGKPLRSLHPYGLTSVHKPISPRLLPLGSPGPVTPMDLEGGESGYLDRGRASVPLGESEGIVRALRAEATFIRREGTTSPAIEAGPQSFF